jgi:CRP/FNR family transcriptional regulator
MRGSGNAMKHDVKAGERNGFTFDVSRCLVCGARNLNMCGSLEKDELDEVARLARCETFSANETLFREGDGANWIYNITDGAIRMSTMLANGRRQVVGFLFAGDFLGFSDDGTYKLTAEAVRGAKVCRFAAPTSSAFPNTCRKSSTACWKWRHPIWFRRRNT